MGLRAPHTRMLIRSILIFGAAALSIMTSVAHAGLTPVTSDGVTLIDDSSLNVTWVADASPSGPVTWSNSAAPGSAQAWVAALNASDYGGYSDWQLPSGDGAYTTNQGLQAGWGLSTDPEKNQLGWLFLNELGNQYKTPLSNAGPFMNLNPDAVLWSSDEFVPGPPDFGPGAWAYLVGAGVEIVNFEGYSGEALAVRSGQVPQAAAPEPTALSLLALGLAGVGLMSRRSKKPTATRD